MGVKNPVARIATTAPSPSILTSATRLPAGVDWSSGIAWESLCAPASIFPECPTANQLKDAAASQDNVATSPFWIYTPLDCVTISAALGDQLGTDAQTLTDAHTAHAVSRALWMGEGLPTDADPTYGLPPTLRRSATDVSIGGLNAALDDAVSALLFAYEHATGGSGGAVLHVPTVLIPSALGGGDGGARVAWPEGSIYRGPAGVVVSPGPGYPHDSTAQGANGAGPLVSAGPPEVYKGNGYNEVWVYISGPVEYAVGPVRVLPETDAERRVPARMNQYRVWAERPAIVRVDPCAVFAALVFNAAGERS